MSVLRTVASITFRAILGRRRTLLLALLAAIPVLLSALAGSGGRVDAGDALDTLIVRMVLPLTALVLGIAALGTEIEDGTAVYLLTKPIERWQIVATKFVIAGGVTAALAATSAFLSGLLLGGGSSGLELGVGLAIAAIAGSFAYAALFLALGIITTRAMLLGLFYILVWEAIFAGILEGTRIFSLREATLGIARAILGERTVAGGLDLVPAVVVVSVVVVGALAVGSWKLSRYEIRGTE